MSQTVSIIGYGIVGQCWARLFAKSGFDVTVYDPFVKDIVKDIVKEKNPLVKFTNNLKACVQNSEYVQECVPESLRMKIKIFKQLDELCDENVIMASSTSNIQPDLFTKNLKYPQRCIVAHPINPPDIIPCVEIVPSEWTDQKTIEKTKKILNIIGKKPIVLKKSIDGFVVNRLQYALIAEAYRLVEQGIATPSDVDKAISLGLGYRWSFMGPLETIHLNAPKGVKDYFERYGDSIKRVLLSQNNNIVWKPETIQDIESEMPKNIKERQKWRDEILRKRHS